FRSYVGTKVATTSGGARRDMLKSEPMQKGGGGPNALFQGTKFEGGQVVEPPTNRADPTETPTFRVRELFPETLLWRPELITDDSGHASLDVELADSITTWRLSASAVTADGRLGAAQSSIRVFQPFFVDLNLPVSLTRGDEVSLPVVVYNYLAKSQTVELKLE